MMTATDIETTMPPTGKAIVIGSTEKQGKTKSTVKMILIGTLLGASLLGIGALIGGWVATEVLEDHNPDTVIIHVELPPDKSSTTLFKEAIAEPRGRESANGTLGRRQLSTTWQREENAYCSRYEPWGPFQHFWRAFWTLSSAQAACDAENDCTGIVQHKRYWFSYFKCAGNWDRQSFYYWSHVRTYIKPAPAPPPAADCSGFQGAGVVPAFPSQNRAMEQLGCHDRAGVSVYTACISSWSRDDSHVDESCYLGFPSHCYACFEEHLSYNYEVGAGLNRIPPGMLDRWGNGFDRDSPMQECFDDQLGGTCSAGN